MKGMLCSLHRIQERVLVGAEHFSIPSVSFSSSLKEKRSFFKNASSGPSQCTCALNVRIQNLDPSCYFELRLWNLNWSFNKESETIIIHHRHCPMWYTSRKDTMYRFQSLFFGWRLSGSLWFSRLPHTAFTDWRILPSLTKYISFFLE